MLQVRNLSKSYSGKDVVKDISFSAEPGDVVGFLGLNGAGKTTTLKMLSTFLAPTTGIVEVDGVTLETGAQEIRQSIGYLPEHPPLYPELTVHEYLKFVADLQGVEPAMVSDRVAEVIEQCSLQPVERKLCGRLSKGYRQRVGIAQSIIHQPKLLLLDEPTTGLDTEQMLQARELLRSVSEHSTVILSTHLFSEVSALCSKVVIIHEGRVLREQLLESGVESVEALFLSVLKEARDA